jgi:hypothetical protein
MLCSLVPIGASTVSAAAPSIATGEDWSLPSWVTANDYSGFYNMDSSTPTTQIRGIGATLSWNELNPDENDYNFDAIDDLLEAAATQNLKVAIRIKSSQVEEKIQGVVKGPFIADWVLTKHSPAEFYTKGSSTSSEYIKYAAFWNSGVQAEYKKFVEEFASHGYFSNPHFVGVYLHGVSSSRGEEFHIDGDHQDDAIAAGLTSTNLVQTFQDRITWWSEAAGANAHKLAWVGAGDVGVTYDKVVLDQFALDHGLGLRGGFLEHYFNTPYSVPNVGLTYNNGYVEVDWSHPIRSSLRWYADEIEECDELFDNVECDASDNRYDEKFHYMSMLFRGAQLGMNYMWTRDQVLNEAGDITGWYLKVAGKRPYETPDAVAWLRQAEVRFRETPGGSITQHTWKNLEHLLMQRDIGAGYNTVVNSGDYINLPNNSMKVSGQSGEYTARRTNIGGGNNKMAFFLNEAFENSITGGTQVKVTYHDNNTTTWKLKASTAYGIYDAGTVTNTNSGSWKTATFTVPYPIQDGSLPSDIDLMLEVTGSSDLKVRFVRVVKQDNPSSGLLTTSFNPTADSYVKEGTDAGTNFGTNADLVVKDGDAGFDRQSYLKFDLSSFTGNITEAKLKLRTNRMDFSTPPINVGVYPVSSDSWTESGIMWNNKPAIGTYALDTEQITSSSAWYTFDVSSYVNGQVNGDKVVSLNLKDSFHSNNGVDFDSKEAANDPVLEVKYTTVSSAPSAIVIDNFNDGNTTGWDPRVGTGAGNVDMAVDAADKPDGSSHSAAITFNYGTSANYQYRYYTVNGASWPADGAIRLWFKGDSANGTLAADKLKLQIRESDGDRWSYEIGTLSASTSWQRLIIPYSSFKRDGTTGDGAFELSTMNEFNVYSNSNSKTIRVKIDQVEVTAQ